MSSGSLQSEARQGMYSLYSQEKGLVEIKRLAGQNSTKKGQYGSIPVIHLVYWTKVPYFSRF
jgi:hypothetical protein